MRKNSKVFVSFTLVLMMLFSMMGTTFAIEPEQCGHENTAETATAVADKAGFHEVTCEDCNTVVEEACDTNGVGDVCSKCGYDPKTEPPS